MIKPDKIEIRKLMRHELNRLLKEAPLSETRFLRELEIETGIYPYDFFDFKAIENKGLVINDRPIYIACILKDKQNKYIFWTVVTSNVENKITLCNSVRRELKIWLEKYKIIYATMEKINPINMKWVEWLGFIKISEDNNYITYRIGE